MNKYSEEKEIIKKYFDEASFERWKKIYGEDDSINWVLKYVREGHIKSINQIISWLGKDIKGRKICDSGCGMGNLSILLAEKGAFVDASDISIKMIEEAKRRLKLSGPLSGSIEYSVKDIEEIQGSYDTVICLDVLIHYEIDMAKKMLQHLSNLAENCLIISLIPKTPKTFLLDFFKKVHQFLNKNKTKKLYLHSEKEIFEHLSSLGWKINAEASIKNSYYCIKLLLCEKKAS